jgi:hypothetical protein
MIIMIIMIIIILYRIWKKIPEVVIIRGFTCFCLNMSTTPGGLRPPPQYYDYDRFAPYQHVGGIAVLPPHPELIQQQVVRELRRLQLGAPPHQPQDL